MGERVPDAPRDSQPKDRAPGVALSRSSPAILIAILALAAGLRLLAIDRLPIAPDEVITLVETAGHVAPSWPRQPFPAGAAREIFRGSPGLGEVTAELGRTDVHPPVYFWMMTLWRQALGYSIETARLFSLFCFLGTLLLLHFLLRAESVELSWVATAVYAFAPGIILSDTSARPYSLALFLLAAAAFFAYRGARAGSFGVPRSTRYAAGMALCSGLAVLTNYLAFFSVAVILGWYFLIRWPRHRAEAIAFPILALVIVMTAWPLLSGQLNARPDQETGRRSIGVEIKTLSKMGLMTTFLPDYSKDAVSYTIVLLVAALLAAAIYELFRSRRAADVKLWLMLAGLALAPPVGILLLNRLFNKFLQAPRYLIFAAPAIVAFVSYPVAVRLFRGRFWVALLLVSLVLLRTLDAMRNQAREPSMRGLARVLRGSPEGSRLVILDEGWSLGWIGSLLYELDRETPVLVLPQAGMPGDVVTARIGAYDEVWLFFSFNPSTASLRKHIENQLTGTREYDASACDFCSQSLGPWPGPVTRFRKISAKGRREG